MKFDNSLPVTRLPIRRGSNAARRYRTGPVGRTALANDALMSDATRRRAGQIRKVVDTVASCGDFVFHGVILTVLSWTVAQVLEGCAAYAFGMYPYFPAPDEPRGGRPEHASDSGESTIVELRFLENHGEAETGLRNVEYLKRRRIRQE